MHPSHIHHHVHIHNKYMYKTCTYQIHIHRHTHPTYSRSQSTLEIADLTTPINLGSKEKGVTQSTAARGRINKGVRGSAAHRPKH